MSKVISFRLNPENQREAKALTVIQKWLGQGFSTRHIMTEALLNLDSTNFIITDHRILNNFSQQINDLLENIRISTPLIMADG
jgi:hypothetical protein